MTNPTKVNKTDKTEDQSGIDVDLADIPLPPPELDDDLDNSVLQTGSAEASAASKAEPKPVEKLEFLSDLSTREDVHILKHPFRWNGEPVTEIPVRRLTVAEVGRALDASDGPADFYDVYAAMTGYPAAVLRGLMDEDGDVVVGKCRDFFPQMLQAAKGS
ncbi:hypothetical protein [Roseibium sp. MB-4]